MIVGGKQRLGANLAAIGVFYNGARNAHTVKGRGTATYFVVNNQALLGCIFENIRNLVHFQHKGGLSRCKVVGCAYACEDLVHNANACLGSGNKRTDLRHDRNESHLAHICRFTRHVGARDEHQAVFVGIKVSIVGHEIGILNELLNNGVATILNDDLVALCDFGAHVFIPACHNCQRTVNIQFGKQRRRFLNAYALLGNKGADLLEKLIFQSYGAVLSAENGRLHILELGRDVTLTVGKRLLANIVLGHLIDKRLGNLNIVTEYPVVANAKRANACFFAFFLGDFFKPGVAVLHNFAQGVKLFAISLFNHFALSNGKGGRFYNSGTNARADIVKRIKLGINAGKSLALGTCQKSFDFGEYRCRIADRAQILGVCVSVNDAGNKTLQIKHVRELLAKLGTQHKAVAKLFNGTQAALDGGNVEQRLFYPFAQHTLACRGFGFIKHPQKRALFILVAHRIGELQIATRVDVHFEVLTVTVNVQIADVGDVAFFGFLNVIKECTDGRDHCAIVKILVLDLLAKLRKNTLTCRGIIKACVLVIRRCNFLTAHQKFANLAHVGAANVNDRLARCVGADFGFQSCVGIFARKAGGVHLTRRGIGKADAIGILADANGAQIVIALLGEQA